jgi:hypothetical protein
MLSFIYLYNLSCALKVKMHVNTTYIQNSHSFIIYKKLDNVSTKSYIYEFCETDLKVSPHHLNEIMNFEKKKIEGKICGILLKLVRVHFYAIFLSK